MDIKKLPLISIITVVYNGKKYLEQTIESVLNQTYKNIEYLIIDGGSTDGTLDIIKKHESQLSTWISEPDDGLYDAMNKGIRMANGEIIGIINSDDWYSLNAIKIIVDSYSKDNTKRIFHGDRMDILPNGSKKLKRFHSSKLKLVYYGMTYNHPSMFVHKDIYKKGLYNTKLRALSDFEFVLKNLIANPKVFVYLPQAYVYYRLDGLSGTMSTKDLLKEGYISRKNAGLNKIQNSISYVFRATMRFVNRF